MLLARLVHGAAMVAVATLWLGCSGSINGGRDGGDGGSDGPPGADGIGPGHDRPGGGDGGPGPDGSGPGPDGSGPGPDGGPPGPDGGPGPDGNGPGPDAPTPPPFPDNLPPAGNPDGHSPVPAEAQAADTSNPTTVVGNGSPDGCTSDAVVAAVANGGIITFDCGPDPLTITLDQTAKVVNTSVHTTGNEIVIDGGGLVTLSGGGQRRILYMDTCDQAQGFLSDHCQDDDQPHLTVQNLTFVDGNSTGETFDGGGGGAIFVRGGRFKIANSRFFRNTTDPTGPDVGGAAVRVLSQFNTLPVYVVNSTFGGAMSLGNSGSNGGGLSSIGVSYTVINSLFSYNTAIGNGANPAQSGTPGGGSGGAIYNDGNTYTLTILGTLIEHNHANEGGGAIFYVSNDRSGTLVITDSTLTDNPSDGFETQGYKGIFYLGNGDPQVTNSTLQ
jgi:hypothetical protein